MEVFPMSEILQIFHNDRLNVWNKCYFWHFIKFPQDLKLQILEQIQI
jgi:hypothetical protein